LFGSVAGTKDEEMTFRRSALHLGALWAVAIVQPLFGLLGDNAEFFVAHQSTAGDILSFALAYALVPPLAAAGVVALVGRARPALGGAVQVTLVGLLAAALVLPHAGEALSDGAFALGVAVAVGAAGAFAYSGSSVARSFLTVLSPAPLVVTGVLLLATPVSDLVVPGAESVIAGPARSDTPIVHVIFDELPLSTLTDERGRVDERLFPNFARLARGATWYRNATSVADHTVDAVPTQLTGLRPQPGALPTSRAHPHSLFTLFARSHVPVVVEPITDVCPDRVCAEVRPTAGRRLRALVSDISIVERHLVLPAGQRRGLPAIDGGWAGFGAPPKELTDFEADLADGDRPHAMQQRLVQSRKRSNGFDVAAAALARPHEKPPLVFVHSPLPHAAWTQLPDGRTYPTGRARYPGSGGRWSGRQWVADQSFQRHVLQTQLADVQLGALLDRLREAGLYDRAVIAVTADHGASFDAGQRRRQITAGNFAAVARVPFVVKRPGQRSGVIDDRAVRTVDVLPVIAQAAGVRVPWRTDGHAAGERRTAGDTPIGVLVSETGKEATRSSGEVGAQSRARERHEATVLRDGIYAVGPRPDLIGTRAAGARMPPVGVRATLDAARAYATIAPGARSIPALASGTVTGLPVDAELAVAVNGRVEATTRVRRSGATHWYEALIRPASLRSGRHNGVAVLQVLPGGRLARIGGTSTRSTGA
jgi:hypothetical protein